jgi:hypothetical protein
VQRTPARGASSTGTTSTSDASTIRRELPSATAMFEPDESTGSDQPPALSPAQLSAIIRAVEDRLLEEIERRGGLSRGAF